MVRLQRLPLYGKKNIFLDYHLSKSENLKSYTQKLERNRIEITEENLNDVALLLKMASMTVELSLLIKKHHGATIRGLKDTNEKNKP